MSTAEAAPKLDPEPGPEFGPEFGPAWVPENGPEPRIESGLGWGPGAVHPVLAELAAVRAALGRVGACPGWSMSDAEVTVALEQLLAARAQLEALTATQVAAAETRGLRAELNQSSTTRWLRRRFRVSGGEAGRLHTLAQGLGRWQATAAALAAGRVGTEQAAAITQVLDALPAGTSAEQRGQAEDLLLEQAATLDPGELAACGRVLIERLTTTPDVDDPEEEARLVAEEERAARDQHARRELSLRTRRDGMVGIHGLLEPFTGALMRAALEARAAKAPEADGLRDERSKGQRMADALTELATTAGPATTAAGSTPQDTGPQDTAPQDPAAQAPQPASDATSPGWDAPDSTDAGAPAEPDEPVESDETLHPDEPDGDQTLSFDETLDPDEASDPDETMGGDEADASVPPDGEAEQTENTTGARAGAATGGAGVVSPRRPGAGLTGSRVSLIVDWHRLLELRPRAGMLEDGTVLAPSVLLAALCNAEVLPMVFTGPARPLRLGRTRRLFTHGQHAVLAARDRGCAFPGCTRPPTACAAHHGRHWTKGGRTDIENGCLLCEFHHAQVHREGWDVRLARNGYPEFIPPPAIDPTQRPRQHLRYHPRE